MAAMVPVSVVLQYEGRPDIPPKKRKTPEYVIEVSARLSEYFNSSTIFLLDEGDFSKNTEFDLEVSSDEKEDWSHDDLPGALVIPHISEEEDSASLDELQTYYVMLEKEIEQAIANKEDRRRRLRGARKIPQTFNVQAMVYRRNPDVIAEVLDRANGNCEECDSAAPFLRARNGLPYLEVHHRRPLSQGGEDTVENAIALCPNCHRRFHYGQA